MTFDNCLDVVLKYEGDYSNDSNDPGGETKWGISKRAYPKVDIKNLSLENAKQIYRIDYWDRIRGEFLHPAIRLMVFDCAVNQGVARASIYLQQCAGVSTDGFIGPETRQALDQIDPEFIIMKYAKYRHAAYTKNPKWSIYGAGWSSRLLDVTMRSLVFFNALSLASLR